MTAHNVQIETIRPEYADVTTDADRFRRLMKIRDGGYQAFCICGWRSEKLRDYKSQAEVDGLTHKTLKEIEANVL